MISSLPTPPPENPLPSQNPLPTGGWKSKLAAVVIGIGVPIASFEMFKYDEFLHLALKFPNFLVSIFAGNLAGLPLGIIISSFPIVLALASGFSIYYAWRLWNRGSPRYAMMINGGLSKYDRRVRWVLAGAIGIPIYSVVLIIRASGTYFRDGLVPFWIERNFSVQKLKTLMPISLYSLYGLACLVSWIALIRYRRKQREPQTDPNTLPPEASTPVDPEENTVIMGLGNPPVTLFRFVLLTNIVLVIVTAVFIRIYGRRG
jgi:hypothetical protein